MRLVKLIIVFVLMLNFSSFSISDELELDYILDFIPEGKYLSIRYTDRGEFLKNYPKEIMKELNSSQFTIAEDSLNILPDSLQRKWNTCISANRVRLKIVKVNIVKDKSGRLVWNRKIHIRFRVGDYFYGVQPKSNMIRIFSFDNLDSLINHSWKSGELIALHKKGFGRPFYSYRLKSTKKELFFYATETQELLSAESLAILRDMISTAKGTNLSLASETDLTLLKDIFPDLGSSWRLSTKQPLIKASIEYLEENDPNSNEISKLQEYSLQGALGSVSDICWNADGNLIRKIYTLYGSEEKAQQSFDNLKSMAERKYLDQPQLSKTANELNRTKFKNMRVELKDKIVVEINVTDKKTFVEKIKYQNELEDKRDNEK